MNAAIRPRRSLLFMPGANERALEKARELPADGLIFDLEDAVAPDAKAAARRLKFDEFLRMQLALVARKRALAAEAVGVQHRIDGACIHGLEG